ncbi:hypothetical protein WN55_06258 [Dufourea novaeangliae]|uniref:Uncharacterized protein n=1 Tax=Dufourea novaeangliae TaxID=178035 RepID=A0A154PPX4_DUFNO|nr:hypothetical protein WN55_06258 [Dufourea novaeangliae]
MEYLPVFSYAAFPGIPRALRISPPIFPAPLVPDRSTVFGPLDAPVVSDAGSLLLSPPLGVLYRGRLQVTATMVLFRWCWCLPTPQSRELPREVGSFTVV